jgi:hypothetical protein
VKNATKQSAHAPFCVPERVKNIQMVRVVLKYSGGWPENKLSHHVLVGRKVSLSELVNRGPRVHQQSCSDEAPYDAGRAEFPGSGLKSWRRLFDPLNGPNLGRDASRSPNRNES